MKPSTRRAIIIAVVGAFVLGLLMSFLRGDERGSRDISAALVAILLMGGFGAMAWWMRTKPRQHAAQDAAGALGLRFSAEDVFRVIDRPFPLLQRIATVRGLDPLMAGTWQGVEVSVFEYWYARSSNPALDDVQRFSCVAAPLPAWWPGLLLGPETTTSRAVSHVTMREVDLESEAFNRAFTVRSADPRFASALLDARMMHWLLERDDAWGIEIADGMVLCTRTPRLQPWELRPLLEELSAFWAMVPDVVASLFPAAGPDGLGPEPEPSRPV